MKFLITRVSNQGLSIIALTISGILAQSPVPRPKFETFEVATIKEVAPEAKAGRYITMQGEHRFVARNFPLQLLIAAAYDLNPRTISGGPDWVESQKFDIVATTAGDVRPGRDEQMRMLRKLLAERFQLTFRREEKEFSIYELSLAKDGSKLKPSSADPNEPAQLVSTVYPQRIHMPARNATIGDFVAVLQRAILDRPVVDKTGLAGRFDFDLDWAPDGTQFGGEIPAAPDDAPSLPLRSALERQLGLRLTATHGMADSLVVLTAERASAN